MTMALVKLCPGCKTEKDVSEFKQPWNRHINKYCNKCLYPPNREGRSARMLKLPINRKRND